MQKTRGMFDILATTLFAQIFKNIMFKNIFLVFF
jgi:hypothetical protein